MNLAALELEEREEVREIPGWPSYAVTSHGRLWSVKARRFLRGTKNQGYTSICLSSGGADGRDKKRWRVHQLVLLAFVGPRPAGNVCRHLNDMRDDNRLTNLAYGTNRDNINDARRLRGLRPIARTKYELPTDPDERMAELRKWVSYGESPRF